MNSNQGLTNQTKPRKKTMAILKIAHDVADAAVVRIESLVEKTLNYDCNWNGATIEIERDDFTSVECSDDIAGSQLLSQVNQIISSAE
jgi:hypothetical protein